MSIKSAQLALPEGGLSLTTNYPPCPSLVRAVKTIQDKIDWSLTDNNLPGWLSVRNVAFLKRWYGELGWPLASLSFAPSLLWIFKVQLLPNPLKYLESFDKVIVRPTHLPTIHPSNHHNPSPPSVDPTNPGITTVSVNVCGGVGCGGCSGIPISSQYLNSSHHILTLR